MQFWKYGLPEPTRAMLGHHEVQGSQSMSCYSHLLTRPLSQYQSMLMNIRHGYFLPDESRSGRFISKGHAGSLKEEYTQMAETARPWPAVKKVAKSFVEEDKVSLASTSGKEPDEESEVPPQSIFQEPGEDVQMDGLDEAAHEVQDGPADGLKAASDGEDSDSSSSSDGSSSSESINEEELHAKINGDGYVKQHRKTKMLHRPGKSTGLLLCGRRCNDNYLFLKDGAPFHWPRCTGCFRGEVLTTTDQLVEAFDKVRARRSSLV